MENKEFTRAEIEAFFNHFAPSLGIEGESHEIVKLYRLSRIEQPTWMLLDRMYWTSSIDRRLMMQDVYHLITVKDGELTFCERKEISE